jgi:hypothetical protein
VLSLIEISNVLIFRDLFFCCFFIYMSRFANTYFRISSCRIAASKSRLKRKLFVQELERKAVHESERNMELQAQINVMRDEVMLLKNQLLLLRGNCSCDWSPTSSEILLGSSDVAGGSTVLSTDVEQVGHWEEFVCMFLIVIFILCTCVLSCVIQQQEQ